MRTKNGRTLWGPAAMRTGETLAAEEHELGELPSEGLGQGLRGHELLPESNELLLDLLPLLLAELGVLQVFLAGLDVAFEVHQVDDSPLHRADAIGVGVVSPEPSRSLDAVAGDDPSLVDGGDLGRLGGTADDLTEIHSHDLLLHPSRCECEVYGLLVRCALPVV